MPLRFDETRGKIVVVTATGRLTEADYESFVPRMEGLIERWGPLRMLFLMDDFEGWDLSGALTEFRFEVAHRKDLERIAVVGRRQWEKFLAQASAVFTGADVRFYPADEAAEARAWIEAAD